MQGYEIQSGWIGQVMAIKNSLQTDGATDQRQGQESGMDDFHNNFRGISKDAVDQHS